MERDLSEFLDKIDAAEAENLESVYLYDQAYDEGYAKAIDEFINELINWKPQDEEYISFSDVCNEIAERMKKGGVE